MQRGKPLGAGESPRFVGFVLSPAPIRLSPLQELRKVTKVTKTVSPKESSTVKAQTFFHSIALFDMTVAYLVCEHPFPPVGGQKNRPA